MPAKEATLDSATLLRGAGIVSIALAIVAAPIGLVTSIATYVWARKTEASTTLAAWGIAIGTVMIIINVVLILMIASMLLNAVDAGAINTEALCQHRDQWGWLIDSLRYACR